ncbi:dTDP-4-dehydrorhamnose reductase [Antarcticibacterium arcticum]|uniref:dTDP-4-dehydrorhamnose reductase n=1 Tax=Antarcticibacterium arcticum TaxID=2585771 RepID=A0A5B8YL91_9FLAO|nr:dTDP-4-dehydrorhamnose reductase [Antarcticibacterium arcticum]QED38475.1 dTDP-4-dehydrorhamnose reductase [Antarcticibacterium arcticum]
MKTVLVLGASGQLGLCIQEITSADNQIDWLFMSSSEVDITSSYDLQQCFNSKRIDYCINCSAYTNVEKAETDKETAFSINAEALRSLADICKRNNTVLFHISTDYVFNGRAQMPYLETDLTDPINVYGASKLAGENYIKEHANRYFIFRTSWLYSQYGHNFYKTVLRKAANGEELNITTSQTGTPTNAHHLARFIVKLIEEGNSSYGLYHFSNTGETTWYGFAKEILDIACQDKGKLKEDNSYKTIASRPVYSVLDKSKLINTFHHQIPAWEEGVKELYCKEALPN